MRAAQGSRWRDPRGLAKSSRAAHLAGMRGPDCRVQTYRQTMSSAPTTPNTQGQQQQGQQASAPRPAAPTTRFSDWASI
jgi:hypothetical protein